MPVNVASKWCALMHCRDGVIIKNGQVFVIILNYIAKIIVIMITITVFFCPKVLTAMQAGFVLILYLMRVQ